VREPSLDPYRGFVAPEYRDKASLDLLRQAPRWLAAPLPAPRPFQRARVLKAELRRNGETVPVAVKAFGPQGWLRSRLARARGSKAARSWEVANALFERGIGTPRPIAFLERWAGGRLRESYFVTEFAETSSFHDELLNLFWNETQYDKLLNLMEVVARAVRAMHDAGVRHGDLGNQNIFVRRLGPETWGDVQFIDLNRGRVGGEMSMKERAFDLSRLTLPERVRETFSKMYFHDRFERGELPPEEFRRLERRFRRRFVFHTATRPLRHPIRFLRQRKLNREKLDYPAPKDYWIWDERSDQAISALGKRERMWQQSPLRILRLLWETLLAFRPTWNGYKRLEPLAYGQPVALSGRIGMTIRPRPATVERELELLARLGKIPVMLRFHRHESEDEWAFAASIVRRLHEAGHPVAIGLIQDRRAVMDRSLWKEFLEFVLERAAPHAEWAELGHATNRTKWGIWKLYDYQQLMKTFGDLKERYPDLKLMGPAVIDFEYPFTSATLARLPRDFRFDALSLHLYVDRRGSPENRQGEFSAIDKFILARSMAEHEPKLKDEVIVSEVNWFLRDPGGYAHPFAPYVSPEWPDWDVTEDVYADYMLRYYLHALCSGMIDRVYWWRLVAAPFGLIDDSTEPWRPRPAYDALARFLELFGEATFLERIDAGHDDLYVLRFDRGVVGFSAKGEAEYAPPFTFARCIDALGETKEGDALTGRPRYYL